MKTRTFLILFGIVVACLLTAVIVPHLVKAQTVARVPIGWTITASQLNQANLAAWQGCETTDTACTSEVIFCVAPQGATAPTQCAPFPPGNYEMVVYFERSGGTELPNGALSEMAATTFAVP